MRTWATAPYYVRWLFKSRIVAVPRKEAKQARAFGQPWKPRAVVGGQPVIKRPLAHAFEGKEQGQGDDLAGVEAGLWMLGLVVEHVVDTTIQANATIVGRQADLQEKEHSQ